MGRGSWNLFRGAWCVVRSTLHAPRFTHHASRAKWLLLLLALLPTIGALSAPFLLDYDDWWIIASNPVIQKGWSGISDFAGGSLEYSHMQLTYLSAGLDHVLWGDWAGGYRLVNALLHGLSALLVFRLGRTLLRGDATGVQASGLQRNPEDCATKAAFIAALLFTVHPVAVESVAWVIERKTMLAQFFGLAALAVYVTGEHGRDARGTTSVSLVAPFMHGRDARATNAEQAAGVSWPRLAGAFLLLLLAQFGKTSATSFWFVFAAVEALRFRDARWKRVLRAGVMLLPCLLGAGLALTSHSEHFVPPLGGDSALLRIAGALHLHGRAWALVLWPFDLSAFYHVSPAAGADGWAAAGLLIPALVVLLYHRLGQGWRSGLLLVIWAAAALSPNMNPFRGLAFLLQDRYVYRALAPTMLLAAELLGAVAPLVRSCAVRRVGNPPYEPEKAGILAASIIALVLGAYSAMRSATWRSEPRLFADAAAKQPDSAFGHAYLAGNLYFHATNSPSAEPPAGLSAASWQARNEYLRAEHARLLGIQAEPPAAFQQAMLRRSLQEHQAALKCDDYDHLVYPLHHLAEHARLRLVFKQPEAASRLYRRIWEGRPERPTETGTKLEAVRFLAVEAFKAKRFEEGLRYIEEGLKLAPHQPELLTNRLLALEDSGRVEEARAEARRLLTNPGTAAVAKEVLQRLGETTP